MELDVSDPSSAKSFWDRLPTGALPFDALINNAGIYESGWSQDIFARSMAVNFEGPSTLAEAAFLDPNKLCNGGALVYVSSGGGQYNELLPDQADAIESAVQRQDADMLKQMADPSKFETLDCPSGGWGYPCYAMSKALGNAFYRVLAGKQSKMMPKRNLGFAVVCPGWVRTRMGGSGASRSVEEGASSVLKALDRAMQDNGSSGDATFTRDGIDISW